MQLYNQKQSETIRDKQKQLETIRDKQKLETIRDNQNPAK